MTSDRKDALTMPSASSGADAADHTGPARTEAARWLSLMSSGRATAADARALEAWCRDDPAHEAAYARVARAWDLLTPVAERAAAAHGANRHQEQPRQWRRRAVLGGAGAAAAGVFGYGVVRPPFGLWPSLSELRADIRTATGEQRRVAVADGIGVDLNTRSSLALGTTVAGDHRIELVSGEAMITASPATAASCTVAAGGGRVRARGARVDVRFDDDVVRVTCMAGSVQVEYGGRAVTVAAQQQVVYGARGLSDTGAADAAVTAWQEGLLVFRQRPLAEVIAEVNRYRPGGIVLLNQALGHHLVDARFHLDRLDNVLTYLRQAYDARVTELPGGLVLVT